MAARTTGLLGCHIVPITANRDERGCLYEVFRQSWPGAFPTLQWNACTSSAGVARGAHVHTDYDEFYTLPSGHVLLGLCDIRRASPTYRRSVQIEWAAADAFAVVVPRGVAHAVLFKADSVLLLGLSELWTADTDDIGCQWNDPELGFAWPSAPVIRSHRDLTAGSFEQMEQLYSERAPPPIAMARPAAITRR